MTTSPTAILRETSAELLRWHFGSEASHAGLRGTDHAAAGPCTSTTPDAAAVARVDRSRGDQAHHQRVREGLRELDPAHAEILACAYGVTLRNRDLDDDAAGRRRRALPSTERSWRVRLVELYGRQGAPAVLASPLAKQLYAEHVAGLREGAETSGEARDRLTQAEQEGLIGWLLGEGRGRHAKIAADAKAHLERALDAFIGAYQPPRGSAAAKRRSRDTGKTRARVLAFHADHGQEIRR